MNTNPGQTERNPYGRLNAKKQIENITTEANVTAAAMAYFTPLVMG